MKSTARGQSQRIFEIVSAIFLVLCLHMIFMFLSGKNFYTFNPYNSYTKQCLAWLEGRLDLGQDYSWLELAIFEGKYYVSFPPFPSYILLPFTIFFKEQTPDLFLALLSVSTGVAFGVKIAQRFRLSSRWCILLPVFLYCGTGIWQITVDGWVWFIAQNMSLALTLMSLYFASTGCKGRAVLFLVCAAGCRPIQAVYLPLVLFLLYRETQGESRLLKWKTLLLAKFWRYLPGVAVAASFLVLNILRFRNPLEFGHNYLPEFTESALGQFSFQYIAENFPNLFRMPIVDIRTGIWDFPLFNGMNIFLVYPILIWHLFVFGKALAGKITKRAGFEKIAGQINCNLLIILSVSLHILFLTMHKTMGGAHFGNRYIADAMAAVFLGICILMQGRQSQQETAEGMTDSMESTVSYVLFQGLFLGGLVLNMYGVLMFYTQM